MPTGGTTEFDWMPRTHWLLHLSFSTIPIIKLQPFFQPNSHGHGDHQYCGQFAVQSYGACGLVYHWSFIVCHFLLISWLYHCTQSPDGPANSDGHYRYVCELWCTCTTSNNWLGNNYDKFLSCPENQNSKAFKGLSTEVVSDCDWLTNGQLASWVVDWLVGWLTLVDSLLVNWLAGLLDALLVDSLSLCQSGWLLCKLADLSSDWLASWLSLAALLVGWLNNRLTDQLAQSGYLTSWLAEQSTDWPAGSVWLPY